MEEERNLGKSHNERQVNRQEIPNQPHTTTRSLRRPLTGDLDERPGIAEKLGQMIDNVIVFPGAKRGQELFKKVTTKLPNHTPQSR